MGRITDIIRRDIISQYSESELMIAFYEALASEGDELDLAVSDVIKFRTLNFAEGKNLDVIGVLVGQSREVVDTQIQIFFGFDPDPLALSFTDLNNNALGGRYRSASESAIVTRLLSDGEYRSTISAAIQRNISKCTGDEIITAIKFVLGLTGSTPTVKLVDGHTYYTVYIGRVLNTEEKAFLSGLNLLPKPAGVGVGYVEYDSTNYFGFISDPVALGFGTLVDALLAVLSEFIFYTEDISISSLAYPSDLFYSSDFIVVNKPVIIPDACDYNQPGNILSAISDSQLGYDIHINGNDMVVGARTENNQIGAAYVYEFDGVSWVFTQKLQPSDGAGTDRFGSAVAIDGDTIIVGSPLHNPAGTTDTGKVYFYERINTVFSPFSYSTIVLNDEPIAYYRLGELLGTDAIDDIGLQNGTYELSPTLGVPGLLIEDTDTAVEFAGGIVGQNVNLTNTPNFSFESVPFSLEALINLNSLALHNPIISKVDTDSNFLNNEFLWQVRDDGSVEMWLYTNAGVNQHVWETDPGLISSGMTYHLVVTYGGIVNSGKIYINGSQVSVTYSISGTFTGIISTNAVTRIGARFIAEVGMQAFLDGVIDEVAIYDKALTIEQILSHYEESAIKHPKSYEEAITNDLPMGYWRLGESAGTTSIDEIAGLNGTYSGGHALGLVGALTDNADTAVGFDGIDGHVSSIGSLSDFSFIQNTAVFTIECWAKLTGLSTNQAFVSNTPADSLRDKGVLFGFQAPGLITLQGVYQVSMQFVFNISTPTNAITDLDYHHFVGVGDGVNVYIYIDGIIKASGTVGTLSTGDSSHLMNFARYNYSFGPPSDYLNGALDEVSIYDHALTAQQISLHYNIGKNFGWAEVAALQANPLRNLATLGTSVGISANDAFAGSPGDSTDTNGRFYRYERIAGIWQQVEIYTSPTPLSHGHLGTALSMDNRVMAVAGEDEADGGHVHVYEKISGVWVFQQTLTNNGFAPNPAKFGSSIDIDGTNFTIIVGARTSPLNGAGSNNGAAHIFVKSGGVWVNQADLISPEPIADTTNDNYGWDVAVFEDTAFVTEKDNDVTKPSGGAVHEYRRTGTTWDLVSNRYDPIGATQEYGWAVDVDGNALAISNVRDPAVHINTCSNIPVIVNNYRDLALALGPIAYYEMNYPKETISALDVSNSTNQHNGVFFDPFQVMLAPSLISGSNDKASFISDSGNRNHLEIPYHADFDDVSGFSVSFVIEISYLDALLDNFHHIYRKELHFEVYIQNTGRNQQPIITVRIGLGSTLDTQILNIGQRYHIAAVHEANGDQKMYIDGVLFPTVLNVSPQPPRTENVFIGNAEHGLNQLNSIVDGLSIFNIPLTQSDITTLANEALKETIWTTNISWFNHINTESFDGGLTLNSLTKIGGVNLRWDASAVSTRKLTGNGWAEFTAIATNTSRLIGFTEFDVANNVSEVTHGICAFGDGNIYKWEAFLGTLQLIGSYTANDVLRVDRTSNIVRYYHNGIVIDTSSELSTGTVRAAGFLYTGLGTTIDNCVIASTQILSYEALILSRFPVGYWRFGDNDLVCRDASINANDGAYVNTVSVAQPGALPGNPNTSVNFLGTGRATIPGIPEYDLQTEFTIEFWMMKNTTTQSNKYIFNSGSNSHAVIFGYVLEEVEFFSNTFTGDDPRAGTGMIIPDTDWHHVVYTYDGSLQKGYLDGSIRLTLPKVFSINAPVGDLHWADSGTATAYFDGHLDEGVFYGVALSEAQVLESYRTGLNLPPIDLYENTVLTDGPVAYWRLGEDATAVLAVDEIAGRDASYVSVTKGVPGLVPSDNNKAVSMDGSTFSQHLSVSDDDVFSFTNGINDLPFSLEAIIKIGDLIYSPTIISKTGSPGANENEWIFVVADDGSLLSAIYSGLSSNNHFWQSDPGIIQPGITYHVASTYNGSTNTGKLYVNGVEVSVNYAFNGSYTNMSNLTRPVLMGRRFPGNGPAPGFERFFDGILDEVAIYDKQLTLQQIQNHVANSGLASEAYKDNVLAAGPVAYWRMDSITGAINEQDISGPTNLHQMTFNAPGNISSDQSLLPLIVNNTSLIINSASTGDSGALVDHHADFDIPSTDFTAEAWIKIHSNDLISSTFPSILTKGNINTSFVFFIDNLLTNPARFSFRTRISPDNQIIGGPTLIIGETYYVVAMIDSAGVNKLYVNGVMVASTGTPSTSNNNAQPLHIGESEFASGNKLYSTIDELAIYQRSFTDQEILDRYNLGLGI